MKRRAEYSKNAGMTLVELMVAVTILAIIVVPLLHALATSAQVGLKARRNLRITTAAQDIMEGLKAESVESLSCSFNYPDDDVENAAASDMFKNFHVVAPELICDDAGVMDSANVYELNAVFEEDDTKDTYGSVLSVSKAVIGTDASTIREMGRYNFVAHGDISDKAHYKKYCFGIHNLKIENGDDPNFLVDALIKVDGSDYTEGGDHKKTSSDGSNKALLNEHGRISYGALNEKRDAFFIQDADLGKLTAQEFNVAYSSWVGIDCTEKDLAHKFVVTTTNETALDNTKKAADGADWITVKCKIIYTSSSSFKVPPEHEKYDDSNPDQPYTKEYEYTIFDNKLTGYPPDNIFLCYYPGYGAPSDDEIIYVNPQSVPSILHLIKQEGKNNGTLNHDEMNYKCEVRINEGVGAREDTPGNIHNRKDSMTQIRTNLDMNMYKIYSASAPDTRFQGKYYYNGGMFSRDFNNPENCGIFTLGGEMKTSDSMYDVTINIYEQGTLDNAITNNTSIGNDKVLFTLKGSMN